ncbi:MAG: ROK family protein [Proteobacteria bacterium]|nr:ROK family protein [Pseudomonadota bacterium]
MTASIGIDIGGTAIKFGLVSGSGSILARDKRPYDRSMGFEALMDLLADACRGLERDAGTRAAAIGLSTPGHVDLHSGILVDGASNVPSLFRQPVRCALRDRLGLPVAVENDGTAATFGEMRFGAGRGLGRFALVVIGTGIGGGIAIDGKVVTGTSGEPPELGAIVLSPMERKPEDRLSGTFEGLAAASAFLRAYTTFGGAIEGMTVERLFERATSGDAAAIQAIDSTARWIAQAFGTLINALNLEACIIGGGLAGAGDRLAEPVRRQLGDFTWPLLLANAAVRIAERGNDAGVLGAAALAATARASTP